MEQWMQAFCKNCQILVLCCWPHRQKSSLDVWPWILFFRVNYEPLVIESQKLEKPGHPVLSDLKRNLKRILFFFYSSSFCLLKNVYYLSNEISHVGCTKLELKGKIKYKHPQCDHLALTIYLSYLNWLFMIYFLLHKTFPRNPKHKFLLSKASSCLQDNIRIKWFCLSNFVFNDTYMLISSCSDAFFSNKIHKLQ